MPQRAAVPARPGGFGRFEIGLKIHTKKSPQRSDGAQWLAELLASLLPPGRGVREIVNGISADRRIGFVAPGGFCLPVEPWILHNGAAMDAVMADLGHTMVPADISDTYFAAGNMFWFRRPALQMLGADTLPALFETEAAQLDGTVAHAMERIFPIKARRQGYLTVAMPALLASSPDQAATDINRATRLQTEEPNLLFSALYEALPSAAFGPPLRERLLQILSPMPRRCLSPCTKRSAAKSVAGNPPGTGEVAPPDASRCAKIAYSRAATIRPTCSGA